MQDGLLSTALNDTSVSAGRQLGPLPLVLSS